MKLAEAAPGGIARIDKKKIPLAEGLDRKETVVTYKSFIDENIDKQLIEIAISVMKKRRSRDINELKDADGWLYNVLKARGLWNRIEVPEEFEMLENVPAYADTREIPTRKNKNWGTDEEVLEAARKLIEKNGITKRTELLNADARLHAVLSHRKLLDSVFADIDTKKHASAIIGVIDALESFGEREKEKG